MKFLLKQGEQVEIMRNRGIEIKEVFNLPLFHMQFNGAQDL
jgi:hypothetical protein